MRLGELTSPEARALLERGAVALIPAGSTEAHGPHLPLATDVVIAEETCRRAAPAIEAELGLAALVLPPLAFTVTDCAGPFAGTLSLPREAVLPYVQALLLAVDRAGFRAACLVNAHLEPAHRFVLRDAVAAARASATCALAIADPCDRRWVDTLTEEFRSGSCHAGAYETSLVLAAPAGRVREGVRAGLEPVAIDLVGALRAGRKTFAEMGADRAYFGDPAAATAAEGEASYAQLARAVVTVLAEALAAAPRR